MESFRTLTDDDLRRKAQKIRRSLQPQGSEPQTPKADGLQPLSFAGLSELFAKNGVKVPEFEDERDYLQFIAERSNNQAGKMQGYDCPECKNRGYFFAVDEEDCRIVTRDCRCMITRRSLKFAQESGLGDLISRCTFSAFQTPEEWQRRAKDAALRYADAPEGWFCISGSPGTGKTHLCTAIARRLMVRGYAVKYMLWRDISVAALSNYRERYIELVEPLKRVKVLYIDDFLKGADAGQKAQLNMAFELVNSRYNNSSLFTIISSERTVGEMVEMEPAVGSRIREKTKGHYIEAVGKTNWRLL